MVLLLLRSRGNCWCEDGGRDNDRFRATGWKESNEPRSCSLYPTALAR